MQLPVVPNKIGTGIILGFFIPVIWVIAASYPAASIDRPVRQIEENNLSVSQLVEKERAILGELGWRDPQMKKQARQQAEMLLEEDLFDEQSRGSLRAAPVNREKRVTPAVKLSPEDTVKLSPELAQMAAENEALLAALVAEYEELEQNAEELADENDDEAGDAPLANAAASEQSSESAGISPTEPVKEQVAQETVRKDGLVVVGEGKQWLEPRKKEASPEKSSPDGNTSVKQQMSYNPYFGRIELVR